MDTYIKKTTFNIFASEMTDEDWFSLGKSDAWSGQSKISPEQDSQAASMYDLGYSEGKTQRSPTQTIKQESGVRSQESEFRSQNSEYLN
ncbi:hypothetical protein FACHB389_20110 [Nostoc calcicola FACHB-389]|nr:hypothetical protein [Nostoc calcicola FACHB-3891]OKH32198.1 hypothetical protein FACHB389_20110 [Nostoc calcicola FACHB-389]